MKKGLLFVLAYGVIILLLIGIGFFYSKLFVPTTNVSIDNNKEKSEFTQSFKEALREDKERTEKKKLEENNNNRWNPSPTFILVAVSVGAVADIVIVILWARHENRKNQDMGLESRQRKKRITDSTIFWWIIGLGVVQKRHEKLVVDWRYVIAYIVIGFALKFWISKDFV
ncbi:hypothetical protein [Bacillus sinesaloumensis]|uniref:hypothetical protein n=1 Tax=Litchfieldia sinesaloumensis TaxID=1926280 RepID=UPI0009883208|nr:hypothetical protein [Bacillus sinesaloumensis]